LNAATPPEWSATYTRPLAMVTAVASFQAWDLQAEPVTPGLLPAFVADYEGAGVYASVVPLDRYGRCESPPAQVLPYHQRLQVHA